MNTNNKISVVGSGSWGTALAMTAARAGNQVTLWGRNPDIVSQINNEQTNISYLPGIRLDPPISATADLAEAMTGCAVALLVVPAQSVGDIVEELGPCLAPDSIIVNCSKGIDRTSGLLPCETLSGAFGRGRVAALSGPSFAADVARGLPTAVTVAAEDANLSAQLAGRLSSAQFRCYASDDLKGVELGGALKNVVALAVGAARAMQLGASAEAALTARGFAEISRLAVALGAKADTLAGLSGLGDLVLTCSSGQSRNFTYGMTLGRGDPLEGMKLAEGAFTAEIAAEIASRKGVETPIIQSVADVLQRRITPREAVRQLLDRPLRREAG